MKARESKTPASPSKKDSSFFGKENGQGLFNSQQPAAPFFAGPSSPSATVQTKLQVGRPNDIYEKEADATADKVLQRKPITAITPLRATGFAKPKPPGPAAGMVRKKCAACEQEEQVQKKPIFESNAEPKDEPLQRKPASSSNAAAPSSVESGLRSSKGSGSPLPASTRRHMESSFGADFSGVRIHDNSAAKKMSKDLNAQAFTHGRDIYFNSGKYNTSSTEGKHLLAHELTHVVQQNSGTVKRQEIRKKPAATHSATQTHHAAGQPAHTTSAAPAGTIAPVGAADKGKEDLQEERKEDKKDSLNDPLARLLQSPVSIQKAPGDDPADIPKLQTITAADEGRIIWNADHFELIITNFKLKKYAGHTSTIPGGQVLKPKPGTRNTKQGQIWRTKVQDVVKGDLDNLTKGGDPNQPYVLALKGGLQKEGQSQVIGTTDVLAKATVVPFWDKDGNPVIHQIEHVMDWQVIGDLADNIDNLILLDKATNLQQGNAVEVKIKTTIQSIMDHYASGGSGIKSPIATGSYDFVLLNYPVKFENLQVGDEIPAKSVILEPDLEKQSPDSIISPKTLEIKPPKIPKGSCMIKTAISGAGYIVPYDYSRNNVKVEGDPNDGTVGKLKSIKRLFVLNQPSPNMQGGDQPIDLDFKKEGGDSEPYYRLTSRGYGAMLQESIKLVGLSPIEFSEEVEVTPLDGFQTEGKVKSDISLLQAADIGFKLENGDFSVTGTVESNVLEGKLPKPLSVDYSDLSVTIGSKQPLTVGGEIGFSIKDLGKGTLSGTAGTGGFGVGGKFMFNNAQSFKKAEIGFKYFKATGDPDGQWQGSGELAFDSNLIPGVKNADIKISYQNGTLSGDGTAQLSIPGVDAIALKAQFDDTGNFSITGKVNLKNVPGIKSSDITATISNTAGNYALAITGTATPNLPNIPGLGASFTVSYDKGVFDFAGTAVYKEGKLDGSLTVGVTNAAIDENGVPSKGAGGDKMSVYGNGSLKLDLVKGADVTLHAMVDPSGSVFVWGDINVNAKPFDPVDVNKVIFKIDNSIPLVGVPFVNVNLRIGAAARFYFHWDPLTIDLHTTLNKTNIADIGKAGGELTAKLSSNAKAGIELSITAGVGVTITVITVSANVTGSVALEINAELGAEAKATWDLQKGLQLESADAYLKAAPAVVFKLTGDIRAELDLVFTKTELYKKELGSVQKQLDLSQYAFGVKVPLEIDDSGKIKAIDYDKLELQPPFDQNAGNQIVDKSLNDDKSGQANAQEEQAKAKIRQDVTAKLSAKKAEGADLNAYAAQLKEEVLQTAPPALTSFVDQTIQDELKALGPTTPDNSGNPGNPDNSGNPGTAPVQTKPIADIQTQPGPQPAKPKTPAKKPEIHLTINMPVPKDDPQPDYSTGMKKLGAWETADLVYELKNSYACEHTLKDEKEWSYVTTIGWEFASSQFAYHIASEIQSGMQGTLGVDEIPGLKDPTSRELKIMFYQINARIKKHSKEHFARYRKVIAEEQKELEAEFLKLPQKNSPKQIDQKDLEAYLQKLILHLKAKFQHRLWEATCQWEKTDYPKLLQGVHDISGIFIPNCDKDEPKVPPVPVLPIVVTPDKKTPQVQKQPLPQGDAQQAPPPNTQQSPPPAPQQTPPANPQQTPPPNTPQAPPTTQQTPSPTTPQTPSPTTQQAPPPAAQQATASPAPQPSATPEPPKPTPQNNPPSPTNIPPFNYEDAIARAKSPQEQANVRQIKGWVGEKTRTIQQEGAQKQKEISKQADHTRQKITADLQLLSARQKKAFDQCRLDISSNIATRKATIQSDLLRQKEALRNNLNAEYLKMETDSAAIGNRVIQFARDKESEAGDMKQKETDRVTKQVSGQAAEARQKGQQKSATIRDEDPKRAKAQQDAVQALAEQQAADIESTLPKITASITDDTAHLADGFVSHATEIAAQFQEAVTRTNSSVTDLIATACRQMDAAASQAITILDQIRTTIIGQVNALERQFMSVLARLPQTAMDGIAANEKASLDNIDATTRDSVAGLNESAVQCITADKGIAHLPPELNRISANASKGFEAVHNTNGKQLDAIDQHFREKTAGLESQLGTGLDKAKGQAGEVGGKITGQMTGGFGFVLQNTRQTVAVMAGQLLAGFSKKGDDTISELKTSFEKGKATVLKAANDSLHENDQALSQLDGNLTKAAEKAADEYDTPAWKRALISIGKVAIGLILSIVATYVIAAVIFVGGLLLVGLGIISGITFATALLIAMVVVAVGFVAYEFITRLEEYKAEHGPIGSFWKALGVSFALLGISIASLTGIPSIIEGLRGHKFFSDRELSTQERYDMVIGGFVQALLLFTGFRAAKAAREGKTPGGIPRFFERVNREIEFRLKQWIGEKGKPPIPKGDPPQPRVPDPDEVPHPAMSEELKAIRASLKDRKAIEQFDYMYEGKKYNNAGMERLIKSITEGLTKKKGGGTLEDELIQRWNYRFAKPSGESLPEVGPLLSRAETLLGEVEAFSAKNKIDMPDIKKQLAADIKLLEEMQNGTKVAAKDSVDGARAHIDGEEAELNEARDSKGLKASGAKVKLGTGEVDVDIVWDNGRQWTEVKSGDSFGLDSGHWVSKDGNDGLKPQLIRLLAAAKANPVDGKPPRITVSFTKGVGPDVAKAINDMGINVKGNKVMPLIICHGDDPCGDDSTIRKKAETDQDGHYTGNYIFDPGHDGLNASFFNQVKKDVARGPLDDTAIEALRTDAIRRNGTVMHAELLLMAAMRNPVNVTLMHAHHAGPLVIPMSQIKKSDEDYLTNFGRDAVPADIVDLDLRLLAAAMGFSTENIDALIDKLDTRAQEQIKLYAGRQFSDLADKLIIDAGSDPKIPLTEILTAMVNGASDSTPGDRIMAGSVYDVAKKANHPMASQILSGALKVDALIPRVYPRIAPNSEAQYVYSTDSDVEKSDTLYVQTSMDIFKLRHRALIIHELTHAADDFAASNTRQEDSLFLETHAYKEQGRYMMDQILGDAPNKPEGWFNAAASYAKDSKLYYWSMVAAAKDNESRYKDVLVEINTHAPMSMDAARVRADLAMSVADLDAKVRTELLAYRDAAGHAAYSAGTTRLEGQKGQYFHKD